MDKGCIKPLTDSIYMDASVYLYLPRIEELVAKEERLKLLENALASESGYVDIDKIKKIFGIK